MFNSIQILVNRNSKIDIGVIESEWCVCPAVDWPVQAMLPAFSLCGQGLASADSNATMVRYKAGLEIGWMDNWERQGE